MGGAIINELGRARERGKYRRLPSSARRAVFPVARERGEKRERGGELRGELPLDRSRFSISAPTRAHLVTSLREICIKYVCASQEFAYIYLCICIWREKRNNGAQVRVFFN